MKIILPMSGFGKRFVAAGYTDPKPLLEVDGQPMIKHVMDLFSGETDFHCICNREHIETTAMRSVLEGYGATVHVIEPHSLGPVYAVLQIAAFIGDEEEVIVSYCDYGTVWDYAAFLKEVRSTQVAGAIAAYRGFHPHMLGTDNYAFLRLQEDGSVAEVREKEPFTQNRMEEYASNGTYYFRKGADVKRYFQELIDLGIQKNGEYYVSLVYTLLLRDSKTVSVFEIQKMLQWGTPKDLAEYVMWSDHFKGAAQPSEACESSATLVLPLAGRGSRFLMNGFTVPKPLLDINGKSMIVRAVESIPQCATKTFICLKEHMNMYPLEKTLLEEFAGSTVIGIDGVTEGQACTCEIGLQGIDPETPILISACDNGVDYDKAAYKRLEADPTVDVIVWSFTNSPTGQLYPHMYAWLAVDADNTITHVSVKKPLPGATHAIIGTMFFRSTALYLKGLKEIYEKQIKTNGEFYVDNLLNPLIEAGYNVKVFPVNAYICWGTPNDYKTYQYWLEHFSKRWGAPLLM